MYKKKWKNILSFRLKLSLIVTFILTFFIILIITSIMYFQLTSTALTKQAKTSSLRLIKQLEYNMDQSLSTGISILNQIMVENYFENDINIILESSSDVHELNDIYDYFNNILNNYPMIDSVFYFSESGTSIGIDANKRYYTNEYESFFYQSEYHEQLLSNSLEITGLYDSNIFFNNTDENMYYISLGRRLNYFGINSGYIIINIDEDYLSNIYQNDEVTIYGDSYIIDYNNQVISSNNKNEIHKIKIFTNSNNVEYIDDITYIENPNSIVIIYPFKNYPLKYIHEIPYSIIFQDVDNLKRFTVLIFIGTFIIAITIGLIWIYKITSVLNNLLSVIDEISSGNIGLNLEEKEQHTLGSLGMQFNYMSTKIKDLIKDHEKKQKEITKLEIDNLQKQITPHFMYNTLNTIKWMAIINNSKNIEECVSSLGFILKAIYKNEDNLWSISEEIEYIDNYIKVMNYRMGNSINIKINNDNNLSDEKIPKFILQPICENAILHGNPEGTNKINIHILFNLENDIINITVMDDGIGINDTSLKNLKMNINNSNGIGLSNVNKRIKLICGEDSTLTVNSKIDIGTEIKITYHILN